MNIHIPVRLQEEIMIIFAANYDSWPDEIGSLCALRTYDFYREYYSFYAGNAPEARRDLNIATKTLLAYVTG